MTLRTFRVTALAALALLFSPAAFATDDAPAPVIVDGADAVWTPVLEAEAVLVTLRSADGVVEAVRSFPAGARAVVTAAELAELGFADGRIDYEVIVVTTEAAADDPEARVGIGQAGALGLEAGALVEASGPVITGNQTIRNALCVGFDCADDENYTLPGAEDTVILLKENNNRIYFDDTSTAAGFPANDWFLVANDRNENGDSYFAIDDATSGTRPFRIDAGAGDNSLRVYPNGEVLVGGFAATPIDPAAPLEIQSSDTPNLRLYQDDSAFGAYTWRFYGAEFGSGIANDTEGTVPFGIRPGASDGAFVIQDVGVVADVRGTTDDGAMPERFYVAGPTSLGYTDVTLVPLGFDLAVQGASRFQGRVRADGDVRVDGLLDIKGDFVGRGQVNFNGDYSTVSGPVVRIKDQPTGTNLMILNKFGDLTIAGSLNQTSDASVKEDVVAVDPEAVLAGVAGLDISTWTYIADEDAAVHMGPMAQDFWRTFGLGQGETTISSVDADGVALASVQALHARSEVAQARVEALEAENTALEARVAELERLVEAVLSDR